MELSIIIPTYNEEEYIEECLKSLIQQNYPRNQYEIILSDQNSTDKTVDIARVYANKIIVESKRGIAIGRNTGAKNSSGNILVFIDADVVIDHKFLTNVKKSFDNNNVVAVCGIAHPIDGSLFSKLICRGTNLLVKIFNMFKISLFPGVCVAYKRDVFFKVNGFREDFGIVEDLDLSRRISKYGKCEVNNNAIAFVSTRRLRRYGLSIVLYHIFCDIRYLLTGKAPSFYPKSEEIKSRWDLWKYLFKN